MLRYPLPSQLTHERFNCLVTDLYYQLVRNGIDPASNMIMGDRDEVLDDGTTCTHFSLIITQTAADILQQDEALLAA